MTYPPPSPPQPSPEDWLMGGGTKSASFDGHPPIRNEGTIVSEPTLIQKRDFDTGDPLSWPDGRPKMLMQVNISTDQRDPADSEDDGTRALYLEFRKAQAVRDAVKRVGASKLEVGGHLSLTYTSDDVAARKGRGNPPKNFEAEYRAPDPWAATIQPASPPPPQQNYTPQVLPQQAPPAPVVDPALAAWLLARNIDPSQMTPQQAALIGQTMGYTP